MTSRAPTSALSVVEQTRNDLKLVCCARFRAFVVLSFGVLFFFLWAQLSRSSVSRRYIDLVPLFSQRPFFEKKCRWNVNKIPKAKIPFSRKKIISANQLREFCPNNKHLCDKIASLSLFKYFNSDFYVQSANHRVDWSSDGLYFFWRRLLLP